MKDEGAIWTCLSSIGKFKEEILGLKTRVCASEGRLIYISFEFISVPVIKQSFSSRAYSWHSSFDLLISRFFLIFIPPFSQTSLIANGHAIDYNRLNMRELVNMADEDASTRQTIADHMKHVYHIHDVLIRLDHPELTETDTVSISNFEVAHKFLHHFGHMITKLEFSNIYGLFTMEQLKMLQTDIEKHCAKTLEHITLIGVGNYLLSETKEVFPCVTQVSLRSIDYPADNLELNRIYPMMERLEIHVHYPRSLPSIVRHYPNLKHLRVEEYGNRLYNEYVHDLIDMNPQLVCLHLNTFPDVPFLRFIREKLPNLESMELTCNTFDRVHRQRNEREVVHFESMRNFSLHTPLNCPRPIPVSFDHLEKITVDYICDVCEPTIRELFERNPRARIASISIVGELYPRIFTKMIELMHILPELEEVEMPWTHHISTTDMMRMMTDFEKMKKVMFRVPKGIDSKAMEVIAMPTGWEMMEMKVHPFHHIFTYVRK